MASLATYLALTLSGSPPARTDGSGPNPPATNPKPPSISGPSDPGTEPQSSSPQIPETRNDGALDDRRRGNAFPVLRSLKDANSAFELARKVKAEVNEYPVEVYLAENHYYAVTFGGYLTYDEARKRVGFARDRKIAADAYVWQDNLWGENLFK